MWLTKYDPFKEMRELERRLFSWPELRLPFGRGEWTPSVNEREDEKAYYVEVDLPGVNKEDVHVDVTDDRVTIRGERKFKKEAKEEDYYRCESFFGQFQRSFMVPSNADASKIEAKHESGVLTVTIPKKPEAKKEVKKIEVK